MSSILVPHIYEELNIYIYIYIYIYLLVLLTKSILILGGDHVSIKNNIYFYKKYIKKGLCPK